MIKLNLNEVKTQISKYIEMVEAGEVIVVCKRNIPVAEIRSVAKKEKKTPDLGWAKGAYKLPPNFSEMPDEELSQWEGDLNDPLRKYAPKKRGSRKK
jgi:antitoxin (DNA-binding transcriptional repressor) of toxin-antitoxin stability system